MNYDAIVMTPSQTKSALIESFTAKIPLFIKGPPGIGKSAVISQAANEVFNENGSKQAEDFYRDVRVVLLDPVDMRGLPYLQDGQAKWAIPNFLPTSGAGCLLLDELTSAPPAMQAACYQLLWDRKLGDYTLPDDWCVVAAGNRATDRAVVSKLSTALSSRFATIEMGVDFEGWRRWAFAEKINTAVIMFLSWRPELLHDFDPAQAQAEPFPCPRTWEMVAGYLDRSNLSQYPEVEAAILAGLVGQGAAAEFSGFLRTMRNLPNLDGIILNPDKALVPEKPDALYALAAGLSSKATETNIDSIARYLGRIPAEFSVFTMQMSVSKKPEIQNTSAFGQWAAQHSEALAA